MSTRTTEDMGVVTDQRASTRPGRFKVIWLAVHAWFEGSLAALVVRASEAGRRAAGDGVAIGRRGCAPRPQPRPVPIRGKASLYRQTEGR